MRLPDAGRLGESNLPHACWWILPGVLTYRELSWRDSNRNLKVGYLICLLLGIRFQSSSPTKETSVQQRCGVSGIDLLNRGCAGKLVAYTGNESAHPDRRALHIAHADRRLRHGDRHRGLRLGNLSLRAGGPMWRRCMHSNRRRLGPDGWSGAIAGVVLGDAPCRALRLTIPECRALLPATHRWYLLLPVAAVVESRPAPARYVQAGKRHRKAPASRITTPAAFV